MPIMHLISSPFPRCWHKACDDVESLDRAVVYNLLAILHAFVADYIGLRA